MSVILGTVSPTLVLEPQYLNSVREPTHAIQKGNYRNSSVLSLNLGLNSRTEGGAAVSSILFAPSPQSA